MPQPKNRANLRRLRIICSICHQRMVAIEARYQGQPAHYRCILQEDARAEMKANEIIKAHIETHGFPAEAEILAGCDECGARPWCPHLTTLD
jgi:hypothetical protein